MGPLQIDDLRVGDCVLYQDARHGAVKAYVEDISRKSGVPVILLGTDEERIEVECVWCIPNVTLLGKGPSQGA